MPKQWTSLSKREQALVAASIELKQDTEKKQAKELEKKARSRR